VNKLVRDGRVAVVYSPKYGGGWYSWNPGLLEVLFDPVIVDFVEKQQWEELKVYVTLKYPKIYTGGMEGLTIEWIPEGTFFRVNEYDGAETIEIQNQVKWIQA
jgi:hypothetical protein